MDINIEALLSTEVQDWIQEHQKDKVYDLALQKSPFLHLSMNQLVQQVQGRQIAQKKFPLLVENKQILFPPKVNLEQTSSASTAFYKSQIIKGDKIIDITGGLGIDCIYFTQTFAQVQHLEKNETLQSIAQHNFTSLGIDNIHSISMDGVKYLKENPLDFDVLYVDPSRRNTHQQKVFLLEDLEPNILEHLTDWKKQFHQIWIKLSPMIDIQYLIKNLSDIAQIHLVAVKNELKEVLVQIHAQPLHQITAVNLETDEPTTTFSWDISVLEPIYSELKNYVYEPNVAIQKSGFNNALTEYYPIHKLHPNSQLFTSEKKLSQFPGRIFEVNQIIKNPKTELKGKSIQAIHRNFPQDLSTLRKKYKFTTDGTDVIIFTQTQNNVLIFNATRINQ